jgi:hypothetical protein
MRTVRRGSDRVNSVVRVSVLRQHGANESSCSCAKSLTSTTSRTACRGRPSKPSPIWKAGPWACRPDRRWADRPAASRPAPPRWECRDPSPRCVGLGLRSCAAHRAASCNRRGSRAAPRRQAENLRASPPTFIFGSFAAMSKSKSCLAHSRASSKPMPSRAAPPSVGADQARAHHARPEPAHERTLGRHYVLASRNRGKAGLDAWTDRALDDGGVQVRYRNNRAPGPPSSASMNTTPALSSAS